MRVEQRARTYAEHEALDSILTPNKNGGEVTKDLCDDGTILYLNYVLHHAHITSFKNAWSYKQAHTAHTAKS